MLRSRVLVLCAMSVLSACTASPIEPASAIAQSTHVNTAVESFARLRGAYLMNPEKGASYRVEYASIARNTAVVETWKHVSGHTEVTVFFKDGGQFSATHYCGSGIQSTMRLLDARDANLYEFQIVSATNLANADVAHNSGFAYRFLPDGRIERRETWTEQGRITEEWATLQPAT